MTFFSACSSMGCSVMTTVCFLLCDEVTFLTVNAFRIASLTWASHIPHCIPSTATVYFVIQIVLSRNRLVSYF